MSPDNSARPRCRVSIDIGGTFTDIVVQDAVTGRVTKGKVLSTREDPARAVLEAITRFVPSASEVGFLVHGTTVGLNAVIERRGARTAFVTTTGFEDAYIIGGNDRRDIFDIRYRKPTPLLTSENIFGIPGRIGADGGEVTPLDEGVVDEIADRIGATDAESVAICLLFSFLNPEHELRAEAILRTRLGLPVTVSHRVSPEWREYARGSTTIMTAYIAPVIERYLSTLTDQLGDLSVPLHVMQSNGGVMTAGAARRAPIQTLLSGPVGGAIGARSISEVLGRPNVICVDMGGTSFDVSLIVDGQAPVSTETEVDGLPLQMAAVDITGIGAGGGSIAWLEEGALRVGPQSAGALPGPVCYGRGGTQPTVTDANFVLGRVDASNFAGGGVGLDLDAARAAMHQLGTELGLSTERTAQGILDIVNASMADAIRTQTVRRGIDPREFALVAFGGAGPMHAAALAEELEIAEIIIPDHPGTFSAWGMLQTDIRHDGRKTYYRQLAAVDVTEVDALFAELEEQGNQVLREQDVPADRITGQRILDLRYVGQEYSLSVPVSAGLIDPGLLKGEFDDLYKARYGHANTAAAAEIVKLRVTMTGTVDRPSDKHLPEPDNTAARTRHVCFDGVWADAMIVDRPQVQPGAPLSGPVIVEESTATTVVPPGWHLSAAPGGHMLLTRIEAAR